MLTVTLEPNLAEQVVHLAGAGKQRPEALVQEAVRRFLAQAQRDKIGAEEDAFAQQLDALRQQYLGHYVALHQAKVIDHDADLRTLHLRVCAQWGRAAVLLKRVTAEPERDLVFRSPRLERL